MNDPRLQGAPRLADIPVEKLRQLMRYDPETGLLYRIGKAAVTGPRPKPEQPCSGLCSKGYVVFSLFNRQYKGHRVAWALQTGAWPELPIDHINGDRSDNRWVNLREATYQQNARNRASVLEATYVYYRKKTGKYTTYYKQGRFQHHLQTFNSREQAEMLAAYVKATIT